MKEYAIEFSRSARKDLQALPAEIQDRIIEAIEALKLNPHPPGSIKLKGAKSNRLRIGKYRAIYEIQEEKIVVFIVRVRHRKDVYR